MSHFNSKPYGIKYFGHFIYIQRLNHCSLSLHISSVYVSTSKCFSTSKFSTFYAYLKGTIITMLCVNFIFILQKPEILCKITNAIGVVERRKSKT